MKNARFWEFINGSFVKITIKPHQTLNHYQSHSTEEGWESNEHTWRNDGHEITLEHCNDGADCDGRLSRSSSYVLDCVFVREFDKDQTAVERFFGVQMIERLRVPYWVEKKAYQRDYTAEAMGY